MVNPPITLNNYGINCRKIKVYTSALTYYGSLRITRLIHPILSKIEVTSVSVSIPASRRAKHRFLKGESFKMTLKKAFQNVFQGGDVHFCNAPNHKNVHFCNALKHENALLTSK